MDEIKFPKQMTATDEAMYRLSAVAEEAIKEYERLPWWSIKQRFIAKGSLATIQIVLQLLHQLKHKYDNSDGRLN